jgi:hypothetical protein
MPRGSSARSLLEARSLLLKTSLSFPPTRGHRFPTVAPSYTDDDARPLSNRGGLKLLHQISRRADAALRSHPKQAECLAVVLLCRRSGVLEKHLTVLPSARMLKRIAERGQVRNEREAKLVEAVLLHRELTSHLGEWAEVLGLALDPWLSRTARDRKRSELRPNPSLKGADPLRQPA